MSRLSNIYLNNIDLGPPASLAKSNLQLPLHLSVPTDNSNLLLEPVLPPSDLPVPAVPVNLEDCPQIFTGNQSSPSWNY